MGGVTWDMRPPLGTILVPDLGTLSHCGARFGDTGPPWCHFWGHRATTARGLGAAPPLGDNSPPPGDGSSAVSPLNPGELLIALHNIDSSKCDMKSIIKGEWGGATNWGGDTQPH